MILGIFIALIYAIPNLYPDLPTLLFSDTNIDQQYVSALLQDDDIHHWWNGDHLHFSDVDQQMQAKSIIEKTVKGNELSLNLEKQTPKWLQAVSAQAMKLGLDLRGGIHFLLEVDISELEKHKDESEKGSISHLLKSHRIRYTDISYIDDQLNIALLDEEAAEKAKQTILMYMPQYSIQYSGCNINVKKQQSSETSAYVVNQTILSLEKRINELGISEATIQRQGDRYISIDLPGIQDIVHAKKIIGKTATLRFHLVSENANGITMSDQSGGQYKLDKNSILGGDSIAFAHAKLHEGRAIVEIQLDGHAHDFYRATSEHTGSRLAVVYSELKSDNSVIEHIISAPVIKQSLGDNFFIEGSGSIAEARDLALLLRSGALAAPVKFIEETIIGPSLGFDNIFKGIMSLTIGSLIIFIFMGYYYRLLGMIANIALLLNIIVIVAVLSLLGATLTLPGIAGIVLSVGMAVDANVLINERIREETISGAGIRQAVKLGYAKAFTAIIDANVTTFLVMIVLFSLGAGAVKGFAITTSIGILSSIVTSVYVTQIITETLIDVGWMTKVNMSHDWFSNIPWIDFMAVSRKAFIFSTVLLLSCLIIIPIKGINLGLDFTGGGQITIETPEDITSTKLRSVLDELSFSHAQVQTYGQSHIYMIKIPKTEISVEKLGQSIENKIPGSKIRQTEFIGPQVGSKMLSNSIIAVMISLGVMMVYVAIRFEYRFAISAIVSLIHDPILILGIFSLFQIEFNLIALAAVLTILGYSINDTIVVYDRVRETFKLRKEKAEVIINEAINQTLSRTILTSCLTLAVVCTLLILGGDYLRGFSLSLAIGIMIGTYSSVYIAGSMAVYLGLSRDDLIIKPEGN
jgi:protein-export membrane protein SecD/preprotein translocase SecF subunit